MLQPGFRLGRYEIRSLLGVGGMGVVYLAHDGSLNRPVALKVLNSTARADEELRQHLKHEARAASALNHPNILTIYDIGENGEEQFIATEYVEGVTLRQRMLRHPLLLDQVLDIGSQIASALIAAEAAGLVHRDIKPDNIMLRTDGYVKLLDFGLAHTGGPGAFDMSNTSARQVCGTLFYMSPEQLRGQKLDTRSDIWSTGAVLYELVNGVPPFDGDSAAEIATRVFYREFPPFRYREGEAALPRLAEIVSCCLRKDRQSRYQTAGELFESLRQLRENSQRDEVSAEGALPVGQTTTERMPVHETPSHNLPVPSTALVGRERERDEIAGLLRRNEIRVVTLTGPGGTGKTRLSLAIGMELLGEMDEGVWFVPLDLITDHRLVLPAIATVLDVPEGGGSLIDSVKRAVRDRKLLLILDNFEQVIDAADIVAGILGSAPGVKVLATSRAPLRIRGEQEYAVPPLQLPPLDLLLEPAALASYGAVALFMQRAAAAKSDFVITKENSNAIAELCVRLDGLPLAIELAAARVKLLPPRAMLARIEKRLALLTGGARDLPARQQTMRAAISSGYNLLEEAEKHLFATLSVFRGPFPISAAEAIADGQGDVFEALSSLVEKSFLRRDPGSSDDDPRFVMLETIREYGLECLALDGREIDVRDGHARLMTSVAERFADAVEHLESETQNLRAALEWLISRGDAGHALRLAGSLWWFWYVHGHYAEGRRSLDAVLSLGGAEKSPWRASAMTGAGALAFLQCEYDRATELLDLASTQARASSDLRSLARAQQFRGSVARERGRFEEAIRLHEVAMTIWSELGDRASAARSVNSVAFASWLNGDFARAIALCRETLPIFRTRNDTEGMVWSLLNLAASAFYMKEFDHAREQLDEALIRARVGSYKEGVAWSLNLYGYLSRARGDAGEAGSMLRDSLQIHVELGDRWRTASVIEALAGLAVERRDHDAAARLFGAADSLRRRLGMPVTPVEAGQYESDVAGLRESAAWKAGEKLTIEEAAEMAGGS